MPAGSLASPIGAGAKGMGRDDGRAGRDDGGTLVGPHWTMRPSSRAAAGGLVSGTVIGHRTLDAEELLVEVGDDQEEWRGGVRLGHAPVLPRFAQPTPTSAFATQPQRESRLCALQTSPEAARFPHKAAV